MLTCSAFKFGDAAMIWGYFGNRGRARKLTKLADRSITMMEGFIRAMQESTDKAMVEEHLSRRRKARDRYAMLARGEIDDMERIMPTMSNYETWKRSMENETGKFGVDSKTFVWYLKQLALPATNNKACRASIALHFTRGVLRRGLVPACAAMRRITLRTRAGCETNAPYGISAFVRKKIGTIHVLGLRLRLETRPHPSP